MYDSAAFRRSRGAYTLECAFEYFVSLMAADSFLAQLLRHLGMDDAAVGVVSSLISLSFLFQVCALPLLRRVKRLKAFAVTVHFCGQTAFMLLYLIPFAAFGEKLSRALASGLLITAYLGNYAVNALIYKWGNSFVRPERRGVFSGKKEMISLLSGMAVQLLSGVAADRFNALGNPRGVFAFCAVSTGIYCACDLVCLLLMQRRDTELAGDGGVRFREAVRFTLSQKPYRASVWLACLYRAAMYSAVGFVGAYKITELGFSMTAVQVINVVSAGARFAVSAPFGKYADKAGYIKVFRLGAAVMAAGALTLAFTAPRTRWLILPYALMYHCSLAGTNANMLNMTYTFTPEEYFTEAFAVKNALSGLAGFLTSLACGRLLAVYQLQDRTLFGVPVAGQQVLAAISFLLTAACFVYAGRIAAREQAARQKAE
jgi:MFS family permease